MYLFEPEPKNRRLTAKEFEQELLVARAFKRRPNYYLYDKPTYDYFPLTPLVNFDLKYP